ncbi:MAG: hypothetical protein WA303_00550, partial [Bradyrhizobium sp.]
ILTDAGAVTAVAAAPGIVGIAATFAGLTNRKQPRHPTANENRRIVTGDPGARMKPTMAGVAIDGPVG